MLASYVAIRTLEEPKYDVVRKTPSYEIRNYKKFIVASVSVEWNQAESLNAGFRLLAGYIFWGNTSSTSISMTAPVSETPISQKIAMTIPVSTTPWEGANREVTFSMPWKYTLSTLPKPNDARVILKEIPEETRAVLRYTLWSNDARSEKKKDLLLKALSQDAVIFSGSVSTQYYNPPFTIPFMRRNEVSVQVN